MPINKKTKLALLAVIILTVIAIIVYITTTISSITPTTTISPTTTITPITPVPTTTISPITTISPTTPVPTLRSDCSIPGVITYILGDSGSSTYYKLPVELNECMSMASAGNALYATMHRTGQFIIRRTDTQNIVKNIGATTDQTVNGPFVFSIKTNIDGTITTASILDKNKQPIWQYIIPITKVSGDVYPTHIFFSYGENMDNPLIALTNINKDFLGTIQLSN